MSSIGTPNGTKNASATASASPAGAAPASSVSLLPSASDQQQPLRFRPHPGSLDLSTFAGNIPLSIAADAIPFLVETRASEEVAIEALEICATHLAATKGEGQGGPAAAAGGGARAAVTGPGAAVTAFPKTHQEAKRAVLEVAFNSFIDPTLVRPVLFPHIEKAAAQRATQLQEQERQREAEERARQEKKGGGRGSGQPNLGAAMLARSASKDLLLQQQQKQQTATALTTTASTGVSWSPQGMTRRQAAAAAAAHAASSQMDDWGCNEDDAGDNAGQDAAQKPAALTRTGSNSGEKKTPPTSTATAGVKRERDDSGKSENQNDNPRVAAAIRVKEETLNDTHKSVITKKTSTHAPNQEGVVKSEENKSAVAPVAATTTRGRGSAQQRSATSGAMAAVREVLDQFGTALLSGGSGGSASSMLLGSEECREALLAFIHALPTLPNPFAPPLPAVSDGSASLSQQNTTTPAQDESVIALIHNLTADINLPVTGEGNDEVAFEVGDTAARRTAGDCELDNPLPTPSAPALSSRKGRSTKKGESNENGPQPPNHTDLTSGTKRAAVAAAVVAVEAPLRLVHFAAALAAMAHPTFLDLAHVSDDVFENTIRLLQEALHRLRKFHQHDATTTASASSSEPLPPPPQGTRRGRTNKTSKTTLEGKDEVDEDAPLTSITTSAAAFTTGAARRSNPAPQWPGDGFALLRLILRALATIVTTHGFPCDAFESGLAAVLSALLNAALYCPTIDAAAQVSKHLAEDTALLTHAFWVWAPPAMRTAHISDFVAGIYAAGGPRVLTAALHKVKMDVPERAPIDGTAATAAATGGSGAPSAQANEETAASSLTGFHIPSASDHRLPACALLTAAKPKTHASASSVVQVMSLSLSIVLAVQAQPMVSAEDFSAGGVPLHVLMLERVSESAQTWARLLLQRFLVPYAVTSVGAAACSTDSPDGLGGGLLSASELNAREREAAAAGIPLTTRLVHDICSLVGQPAYPAADILAKAFVFMLSRQYLRPHATPWNLGSGGGGGGGKSSTGNVSDTTFARYRVASVDILAHIAHRCVALRTPIAVTGIIADGQALERWRALLEEATKASAHDQGESHAKGEEADEGGKKGGRRKETRPSSSKKKEDKAPATAPAAPYNVSLTDRARCSIFNGLTMRAQLGATAAEGHVWYAARQVHVALWASPRSASEKAHHDRHHKKSSQADDKTDDANAAPSTLDAALPGQAAERLVLDDREAPLLSAGSFAAAPDLPGALVSQVLFLSATSRRSLVHQESADALLLALLGVFRSGTDRGDGAANAGDETQTMDAGEAVRKRVMHHLPALLEAFPTTLTKAAWAVARESSASSSGRIRDASVALLLALVRRDPTSGGGGGGGSGTPATVVDMDDEDPSSSGGCVAATVQISSDRSALDREEVAHCALSALVRLLEDPLDGVVCSAIAAVESILEAQMADYHQSRAVAAAGRHDHHRHDRPLTLARPLLLLQLETSDVAYLLTRLLQLYDEDVEGKIRPLITVLFYRRWFAVPIRHAHRDAAGSSANDHQHSSSTVSSTTTMHIPVEIAAKMEAAGVVVAKEHFIAADTTTARRIRSGQTSNTSTSTSSRRGTTKSSAAQDPTTTSHDGKSTAANSTSEVTCGEPLDSAAVCLELIALVSAACGGASPFDVSVSHPIALVLMDIAAACGDAGSKTVLGGEAAAASSSGSGGTGSGAAEGGGGTSTAALRQMGGARTVAARKAMKVLQLSSRQQHAASVAARAVVEMLVTSLQAAAEKPLDVLAAAAQAQLLSSTPQAKNTTTPIGRRTSSLGDSDQRFARSGGRLGGSPSQQPPQHKSTTLSPQEIAQQLSQYVGPRAAALSLLAQAAAAWTMPHAAAIAALAVVPDDVQDEAGSCLLLHTSQALRHIVSQSSTVQADHIVEALAQVIGKYAGLHQQRVLASAAEGLCAAIEPGRLPTGDQRFFRAPVLRRVYSLMNQCYLKTIHCIGNLHAEARNFPLALRFLFLLAEFLRAYPWGATDLTAVLEDQSTTAPFPNKLASASSATAKALLASSTSNSTSGGSSNAGGAGGAVAMNVFSLITAAVQRTASSGSGDVDDGRQRTLLIVVLRVIGSLCILAPTEYLRRCEGLLRDGLGVVDASPTIAAAIKAATAGRRAPADHAAQHQALTVILEFLEDEERKVNLAALAPVGATGDAAALSSLGGGVVDHNSGMSTWLMQRFHGAILQLLLAASPASRLMAFHIVEAALNQGLLAPSIYCDGLIAATTLDDAADARDRTIVGKAARVLAGLMERHEDAVTGKVTRAVGRVFETALVSKRARMAEAKAAVVAGGMTSITTPQPSPTKKGKAAANSKDESSNSSGKPIGAPHGDSGLSTVVRCAFVPPTSLSPAASRLSLFFVTLAGSSGAGNGGVLAKHRRRRDAFLATLLRCLHQESRTAEVIGALLTSPGVTMAGIGSLNATSMGSSTIGGGRAFISADTVEDPDATPLAYVLHLTLLLGLLPLALESEALTLISGARAALDMLAQAAEQDLSALIQRLETAISTSKSGGKVAAAAAKKAPASGRGSGASDASSSSNASDFGGMPPDAVAKLCAVITRAAAVTCLVYLKTFLRREYGLSVAKTERLATKALLSTKGAGGGDDVDAGDDGDAGDDDDDNLNETTRSRAGKKPRATAKSRKAPTSSSPAGRVVLLPPRIAGSRPTADFIGRVLALADAVQPLLSVHAATTATAGVEEITATRRGGINKATTAAKSSTAKSKKKSTTNDWGSDNEAAEEEAAKSTTTAATGASSGGDSDHCESPAGPCHHIFKLDCPLWGCLYEAEAETSKQQEQQQQPGRGTSAVLSAAISGLKGLQDALSQALEEDLQETHGTVMTTTATDMSLSNAKGGGRRGRAGSPTAGQRTRGRKSSRDTDDNDEDSSSTSSSDDASSSSSSSSDSSSSDGEEEEPSAKADKKAPTTKAKASSKQKVDAKNKKRGKTSSTAPVSKGAKKNATSPPKKKKPPPKSARNQRRTATLVHESDDDEVFTSSNSSDDSASE